MEKTLLIFLCVIITLTIPSIYADPRCLAHQWQEVESFGDVPQTIGSHSMVSFGHNLYIFGGMDEGFLSQTNTFYKNVTRFNTHSGKWKVLDNGTGPSARGFHSAIADPENASMYVYGGLTYNADFSNMIILNDFWKFDFVEETWTQLSTINGPEPRADFSMTYLDGIIYLFGGIKTSGYVDDNALWAYDIEDNEWNILTESGALGSPQGRHAPRLVALKGKIFLNDGKTFDPTTNLFPHINDTWIYNPSTNNWRDITPVYNKNMNPLVLYTGYAGVGGRKLVVYGGDKGGGITGCGAPYDQNAQNSTWIFDAKAGNRTWKLLNSSPISPPNLKRHAGASIGNIFYIYGGFSFDSCPPGQVWNNKMWKIKIK